MMKLIYFNRYIARDDGAIISTITDKQLKPGVTSSGYHSVSLYDGSKPKRAKSFLVHRLIAEAFLGPSSLQINHKNGIKTDNRLENLEYVEAKDNIRHSIEVLGNHFARERNGRSKLTSEMVQEIRSSTDKTATLSERYSVSKRHIADIKSGKYWKD